MKKMSFLLAIVLLLSFCYLNHIIHVEIYRNIGVYVHISDKLGISCYKIAFALSGETSIECAYIA